jgi:TPP-dependent pyruvate/acetoin dehydrogenase alpha subunit
VFSTYRSHYHALLHGLDADWLFEEIKTKGMNIYSRERRFFSSAIVGGCLPIACGTAAGLKRSRAAARVWCFVGDMAASTGAFHEALSYAYGHRLPIKFVVEDNGLSCETPTGETWGRDGEFITWSNIKHYVYKRTVPHCGIGKWVSF